MQRWARAARSAANEVGARPELWIPGALAWMVTVGWLALLIGVVRVPSTGDLTGIGASIFSSSAWPWNAVAILVGALAVLLAAEALFAAGEAALTGRGAGRLFILAILCSLPALAIALAGATAGVSIAPAEFSSPDEGGGPILRTALRLAPFIVALLIAIVAGGAINAAAGRGRGGIVHALGEAPSRLVGSGTAAGSAATVVVGLLGRIGFVAVSAVLLRVLWVPIDERLASSGIDAAALLLLVGFVAIWLCLVLGGGALHAWGTLTWTRLLAGPEPAGR